MYFTDRKNEDLQMLSNIAYWETLFWTSNSHFLPTLLQSHTIQPSPTPYAGHDHGPPLLISCSESRGWKLCLVLIYAPDICVWCWWPWPPLLAWSLEECPPLCSANHNPCCHHQSLNDWCFRGKSPWREIRGPGMWIRPWSRQEKQNQDRCHHLWVILSC